MLNFSSFPVLTTPRLVLRQLTTQDADNILAIRSNEIVNQYLGRAKTNNVNEAKYFIQKINEGVDNKASLYWGICFHDQERVIGTICLWNFSEEENKCEIGYEMLPEFHGKGLMQEAIEKVLDYGFNTLQLKKIEAWTVSRNAGSIKLLERNSFQRDLIAESKIDRSTEPEDGVIYVLLNN